MVCVACHPTRKGERMTTTRSIMFNLICLTAACWLGVPERLSAQDAPQNGCDEGDSSCVQSDITSHMADGCLITFKRMAVVSADEPRWYVSSRRGGGWFPVEEIYWFYYAYSRQIKPLRLPTELLEVLHRDTGIDEINGCEFTKLSYCFNEEDQHEDGSSDTHEDTLLEFSCIDEI